jgi:hypothetical protein
MKCSSIIITSIMIIMIHDYHRHDYIYLDRSDFSKGAGAQVPGDVRS